MTGDFFGPREIIKPVIFGGSDTYIHDEVNRIEHVDFIQDEGTFVKGSQTKGIRVYHLVVDGKLTVDASLRNNYFYDEEKGFFVPFEEDNIQYSYNPSTQ